MKNKTIFLISSIIILIAILIVLIIRDKRLAERPFNHFDFPPTLTVTNNTHFKDVDTIALVLADKVFNYDTLEMIIVYIPEHIESGEVDGEEIEFEGFVQQVSFLPHTYLILMNKDKSEGKIQKILSHEFVHIEQYETGRLQTLEKSFIWEGDTINAKDIGYKNRPFEKEAFNKEGKIKKELKKYLYE